MENGVNQRFKILRGYLGLEQDAMADKILLKRQTVSAIETGRQKITGPTIDLIHKEFGVNKAWLIEGIGEMFEKDKSEISKSPEWRDEAYTEVKSKNSLLEQQLEAARKELDRAWAMVKYFAGDKIPNFNSAFEKAGLQIMLPINNSLSRAQVGKC